MRHGSGRLQALFYGLLPQDAAEFTHCTADRWARAVRSVVVLGFVGAGGPGHLLRCHMGLFLMGQTTTLPGAILRLVGLVDALSHGSRRWETR